MMLLREIGYWIGIAMIAYDLLGHACCALARTTGNTGAILWNSYSSYIWPSISDSIHYDIHWTFWFTIALVLIIQGRNIYYKHETKKAGT